MNESFHLSPWAFSAVLTVAGMICFFCFMILGFGMTSHGTTPPKWLDPTWGMLFMVILPGWGGMTILAYNMAWRPWDTILLALLILIPIAYTAAAIMTATYKT